MVHEPRTPAVQNVRHTFDLRVRPPNSAHALEPPSCITRWGRFARLVVVVELWPANLREMCGCEPGRRLSPPSPAGCAPPPRPPPTPKRDRTKQGRPRQQDTLPTPHCAPALSPRADRGRASSMRSRKPLPSPLLPPSLPPRTPAHHRSASYPCPPVHAAPNPLCTAML